MQMSESHEPIFEPERHGENRDVSPEVDLHELQAYLADTIFENEYAVTDILHKYGMTRRDSEAEMDMRMTRIIPKLSREEILEWSKSGEKGNPLSGKDPERIFTTTVRMTNEDLYELGIYEIFGSSSCKYDFTLKKL